MCELNFVKYDNKLQRNTSRAADYQSPKSDASSANDPPSANDSPSADDPPSTNDPPSADDPPSTNDPPTVQPVTPVVSPEPTFWVIFYVVL